LDAKLDFSRKGLFRVTGFCQKTAVQQLSLSGERSQWGGQPGINRFDQGLTLGRTTLARTELVLLH